MARTLTRSHRMPPSLAHCAISSRLADEIMLADRLHWFGTVAALLATESSDLRQNDENNTWAKRGRHDYESTAHCGDSADGLRAR
ncbi:UNVERIFIED_CONTAM: hypothetical protein DV099_04470 [Bifidobacterium longum]|nr:hypothetical protein [Bifidobacterium longum]